MRVLVSVRSVEEALIAAHGGAHFIDLKEPREGALGGLGVGVIRDVVDTLRAQGLSQPLSATIGDIPSLDPAPILACVQAVATCGVTYVKVGIDRSPGAGDVLAALGQSGHAVIPVFLADQGLDWERIEQACRLGLPGIMVDTFDKRQGSLFDVLTLDDLQRFVHLVGASGAMSGVAGALRMAHVAQLQALSPTFAGFRTAVCAGDRVAKLDESSLRALLSLI